MKRTMYGLQPLYPSDSEILNKIKIGEEVKCDVTKPRNYLFLKKFFALIKIAFMNQDITHHFEAFRRWMICEAGYYDVVNLPDGEVTKEPKSISFSKMEPDEFEQLYKDMVQVVIQVTGATEEMIENELSSFL